MAGVLAKFARRPEIQSLAVEQGILQNMFIRAVHDFRTFCARSNTLPAELHICLSDILDGHGHVDDIYPHFLKHAQRMYPHLECIQVLFVTL